MEKVSDVLITEALLEYSAIGGHTNDSETRGRGPLNVLHTRKCANPVAFTKLSQGWGTAG